MYVCTSYIIKCIIYQQKAQGYNQNVSLESYAFNWYCSDGLYDTNSYSYEVLIPLIAIASIDTTNTILIHYSIDSTINNDKCMLLLISVNSQRLFVLRMYINSLVLLFT